MMSIPSLLGDGKGNYRIHVVGNSGTGKSTVSAYIATKLNVPHISLDALLWGPGWTTPSDDECKERIIAAMAQDSRGWVIDGNHRDTVISEHATDVIWLDPPLWLYLPRILWRTLLRLLKIIPSCAEGCKETWGEVLSTKGIIWYCISQHGYRKQRYGEMLAHTSIAKGGKMRRLNEWDGDLTIWKAGLEEMLRAH